MNKIFSFFFSFPFLYTLNIDLCVKKQKRKENGTSFEGPVDFVSFLFSYIGSILFS